MNKKRPLQKPRRPEDDYVSLSSEISIRTGEANTARGGFCIAFNYESTKKRPQEELRQPEDDFVLISIEI